MNRYDPFDGLYLPEIRARQPYNMGGKPSQANVYTPPAAAPYNMGGKPQTPNQARPWNMATPYNTGGKPQAQNVYTPPAPRTPYNNGGKPQADRGDRAAYERPIVERKQPWPPRY